MKTSFYTESILYWLARGVSALAQRIPPTWNCALGAAVGRGMLLLTASRQAAALDNLRAAFGDRYSPAEYRRILRDVHRNLGMTLLEVAAIPRMNPAYVQRWIVLAQGSRERVEAAWRQGRGLILMAAHFGSWELVSIAGALYGYPALVLARAQGWPRLNQLLTRYRESKGCRVVEKGFAVRDLLKGLREGKIIGILADQDGGKNGVLAPLFGRLASTAPGAIELSMKTGAPVLPIFIVREKGPLHRLTIEDPLVIPEGGTEQERVRAGVAAYLQVLERTVRAHPTQWFWLHRRWKSTPERKILIFNDGKAGHLAQSRALAERLEAAWMKKSAGDRRLAGIQKRMVSCETAEVRYRHPVWRAILALKVSAAPRRYAGGDRWLQWALTEKSYQAIRSAHADWAISCGASTAAVNLLWSRAIRARPIHITRVGFPSWRRFDLAVIPRHDWKGKRPSAAALTVEGALVRPYDSNGERASEWVRLLKGLQRPAVGLLIGGPARGRPLDREGLRQAVNGAIAAAEQLGADLLVTTSRRTPAELEEWLAQRLGSHPRCRLLVLVNRNEAGGLGSTQEAIPCILSLAGCLLVSGDSISMVSEAVSTAKPVVSFSPGKGTKYDRFLREMHDAGRIRLVDPLEVGGAVGELLGKEPGGRSREVPVPDPVAEFLSRWV